MTDREIRKAARDLSGAARMTDNGIEFYRTAKANPGAKEVVSVLLGVWKDGWWVTPRGTRTPAASIEEALELFRSAVFGAVGNVPEILSLCQLSKQPAKPRGGSPHTIVRGKGKRRPPNRGVLS